MLRELISKFKETSIAVLPVAGIVLMLHFTIAPMPLGVLALFLSGTFLLILGMTLFQLGSEVGMTSIGNQIGSKLVELKNLKIFPCHSYSFLLIKFRFKNVEAVAEGTA